MTTAQTTWEAYKTRMQEEVAPYLHERGYSLDDFQPHIKGERFLMRAVTTAHGVKLILLGKRKEDGVRVVIKVTDDPKGKEEIQHERTCRDVLQKIRFAYETFAAPEELLYEEKGEYVFYIQRFLEHECPFLERPLKEQFDLALKAFKAQESARATTYGHHRLIARTFGRLDGEAYQRLFQTFSTCITDELPSREDLKHALADVRTLLKEDNMILDQYGDFLTHTDFVPHNFRVVGGVIYLLDHSSLRFGNKYEGWARFLNFMTLYNPSLEEALVSYVHLNRSNGEARALMLMRLYRLGEILSYYTSTLKNSTGDLHTLNSTRIDFWHEVLKAVLKERPLDPRVRDAYIQKRDELRSEEEKERQVGLH